MEGTRFRPVARGFSRFGRTALTKKGPLSCNERSTFLKNKVNLSKQTVHCYNYTIQDVGIGLADSAAARLEFHLQLKQVDILISKNQALQIYLKHCVYSNINYHG